MTKFITVHQPKEYDYDNCVEYLINVDSIEAITNVGVILKTGDKVRTKETITELKKLLGVEDVKEESTDNKDNCNNN